jgi:hypothetical protein
MALRNEGRKSIGWKACAIVYLTGYSEHGILERKIPKTYVA